MKQLKELETEDFLRVCKNITNREKFEITERLEGHVTFSFYKNKDENKLHFIKSGSKKDYVNIEEIPKKKSFDPFKISIQAILSMEDFWKRFLNDEVLYCETIVGNQKNKYNTEKNWIVFFHCEGSNRLKYRTITLTFPIIFKVKLYGEDKNTKFVWKKMTPCLIIKKFDDYDFRNFRELFSEYIGKLEDREEVIHTKVVEICGKEELNPYSVPAGIERNMIKLAISQIQEKITKEVTESVFPKEVEFKLKEDIQNALKQAICSKTESIVGELIQGMVIRDIDTDPKANKIKEPIKIL